MFRLLKTFVAGADLPVVRSNGRGSNVETKAQLPSGVDGNQPDKEGTHPNIGVPIVGQLNIFLLQEEILSKLNSKQPVRKKAPQMNQNQSQNQTALDEQSNYYEAATKCFKIVEAPEKGRYAVATSDLDAGTLVLQVGVVVISMKITIHIYNSVQLRIK